MSRYYNSTDRMLNTIEYRDRQREWEQRKNQPRPAGKIGFRQATPTRKERFSRWAVPGDPIYTLTDLLYAFEYDLRMAGKL